MRKNEILYVTNNARRMNLIHECLMGAAAEVKIATSGRSAVVAAYQRTPDLILMDYALPDMDGAEACRYMRQSRAMTFVPITILSESSDEAELTRCFAMGVDDYIRMPFSVRELVARVNAQLRRTASRKKNRDIIRVGPVTIDPETYQADCDGAVLPLTHMEFELLNTLARNPGTIFSRDYLLEHVWGYGFNGQTRTVDVHIRNIRAKLKENAGLIRTVRGEGYSFRALRSSV